MPLITHQMNFQSKKRTIIDGILCTTSFFSRHADRFMSPVRFIATTFAPNICRIFNIAAFAPESTHYFRKVT